MSCTGWAADVRVKPRRKVINLGLVRINRTGLRFTSATMHLTPWHTLVLWERQRTGYHRQGEQR